MSGAWEQPSGVWTTGATLDLHEKHKHNCVWETVTSARPLKNSENQKTREEGRDTGGPGPCSGSRKKDSPLRRAVNPRTNCSANRREVRSQTRPYPYPHTQSEESNGPHVQHWVLWDHIMSQAKEEHDYRPAEASSHRVVLVWWAWRRVLTWRRPLPQRF